MSSRPCWTTCLRRGAWGEGEEEGGYVPDASTQLQLWESEAAALQPLHRRELLGCCRPANETTKRAKTPSLPHATRRGATRERALESLAVALRVAYRQDDCAQQ